jgi:hypothetical protein
LADNLGVFPHNPGGERYTARVDAAGATKEEQIPCMPIGRMVPVSWLPGAIGKMEKNKECAGGWGRPLIP